MALLLGLGGLGCTPVVNSVVAVIWGLCVVVGGVLVSVDDGFVAAVDVVVVVVAAADVVVVLVAADVVVAVVVGVSVGVTDVVVVAFEDADVTDVECSVI